MVYIGGLRSTMDLTEISAALVQWQYTLLCVVNVPHKHDGVLQLRPLFWIELDPSAQNPDIYNLNNLLRVCVKVKLAKRCTDLPHCRNCQRPGHITHYCLHALRCIRCREGHSSTRCTLERTTPCKCANCSQHYILIRSVEELEASAVTFTRIRKHCNTITHLIDLRKIPLSSMFPDIEKSCDSD